MLSCEQYTQWMYFVNMICPYFCKKKNTFRLQLNCHASPRSPKNFSLEHVCVMLLRTSLACKKSLLPYLWHVNIALILNLLLSCFWSKSVIVMPCLIKVLSWICLHIYSIAFDLSTHFIVLIWICLNILYSVFLSI